MDEQNDKIKSLKADEVMLQEQIKSIFTQNQRNQENVEELEQYGRRLCLQKDGVPTEKKRNKRRCLAKVNVIMQ